MPIDDKRENEKGEMISIPKTEAEIEKAKARIRSGTSVAPAGSFIPPDAPLPPLRTASPSNPNRTASVASAKKSVEPKKSISLTKKIKDVALKNKRLQDVVSIASGFLSSKKEVKISEPRVTEQSKKRMDEIYEPIAPEATKQNTNEKHNRPTLTSPKDDASVQEFFEFKRNAEALEAQIKAIPEDERTSDDNDALERLGAAIAYAEVQIDKRRPKKDLPPIPLPPRERSFTPGLASRRNSLRTSQNRGSAPPRPSNPAPKVPPGTEEGTKPSITSLRKR